VAHTTLKLTLVIIIGVVKSPKSQIATTPQPLIEAGTSMITMKDPMSSQILITTTTLYCPSNARTTFSLMKS